MPDPSSSRSVTARLRRCGAAASIVSALVLVSASAAAAATTTTVATPIPLSGALQSVAATAGTVPGFQLIGASWSGAAQAGQVRVGLGGTWRPWQPLEVEGDGPDLGSREAGRSIAPVVAVPVWAGEADRYEVVPPAGATGVRVLLVRDPGPGAASAAATIAPRAGAATVGRPPLGLRSAWGARPPANPPERAATVKMAFVHHTVNANDYSQAAVPSILRSIQSYHMDANGWNDIGYNFLIDRFGQAWEGRAGGVDQAVIGAQTEGLNTNSTGIALIGTFNGSAPSGAAVTALTNLLAWKLPLTGTDPANLSTLTSGGNPSHPAGQQVLLRNVSGHRDGKATDCPGDSLYDQLSGVAARASALAAQVQAYPGFPGGVFTATGRDALGTPFVVTGADAGGGSHVRTFSPAGAPNGGGFFAYPGFSGGVRVASGDVDGLPGDEIITGPGPSGLPTVHVSRQDGTLVSAFNAFETGFTGGIYVAAGRFGSVLAPTIAVGAGPGRIPGVRLFGADGTLRAAFLAYDQAFRGGVRVAAADLNGDGVDEIITTPGPGGGPNLRVFRADGTLLASLFSMDPGFHGGTYPSVVPATSGVAEGVVVGAGEGGGPQITVFSSTLSIMTTFQYTALGSAGVRPAALPGDSTLVLGGGRGSPGVARISTLAGLLR